jgi:hypothetical protein
MNELENSGNAAAADASLLISPPPNKTAKARRRPLEPVRIQAENRAPIRVAHPRPPQQQQALEAHIPADAAYAVAPENGRLPPDYPQCIIL